MKIKYLISTGTSDSLSTVDFCCKDMMKAVVTSSQISISDRGYVFLSNFLRIHFCPFCGKSVVRERSMI